MNLINRQPVHACIFLPHGVEKSVYACICHSRFGEKLSDTITRNVAGYCYAATLNGGEYKLVISN
jgi:hypothetical protein